MDLSSGVVYGLIKQYLWLKTKIPSPRAPTKENVKIMTLDRRHFLKAAGAAAVGLAVTGCASTPSFLNPLRPGHARWRGFNLTEKFTLGGNKPFRESDFEWFAGWGFNFARLPMDYRCWAGADGEKSLKEIDQAVALGQQHGVHINLNLHRAPGYCVNPPAELLNLWTDEKALDQCAAEWRRLAVRYKGLPASQVSYDLLNEPSKCTMAQYERVVRRLVKDIREADPTPGRVIMADGHNYGTVPVPGVADLGIMQSTRGYNPSQVSHYKAPWAGNSQLLPTWPLKIEKTENGKKSVDVWDKDRLRREVLGPWKELEKKGVKVHVGEFGAYSFTPHPVLLAWMGDYLSLWKEAGWGWSLWEFRGSFGILDSGRKDIAYEDFKGHKLDRKLLELLRQG